MDKLNVEQLMSCFENHMNKYTSEEKELRSEEKNIVYNKVEEINSYMEKMNSENISEQQLFEAAYKAVKADDFIDTIHPNQATATPEENESIKNERSFVYRNIDEIDDKYFRLKKKCIDDGQEYNNFDLVKQAIDFVKNKIEGGIITAEDIKSDMQKGKFKPEELTMLSEKEKNELTADLELENEEAEKGSENTHDTDER